MTLFFSPVVKQAYPRPTTIRSTPTAGHILQTASLGLAHPPRYLRYGSSYGLGGHLVPCTLVIFLPEGFSQMQIPSV